MEKNMGKSWKHHSKPWKKNMGKSWKHHSKSMEPHGKIMANIMERHGPVTENNDKNMETYRNIIENHWENMGKSWE